MSSQKNINNNDSNFQEEQEEEYQEEEHQVLLEHDPFWFEDPSILIKDSRLRCYMTSRKLTFSENLNALVRLSFYISIILFFLFRDYRSFYLFFIFLLITYFLWNSNKNKIEKFEKVSGLNDSDKFRFPTSENPLMNPLITDINSGEANKLPSFNQKTQEEIDIVMNQKFYSDLSDLYEKNNADRQFYTVPAKSIPNDQEKFANWLYYPKPTLKESNL